MEKIYPRGTIVQILSEIEIRHASDKYGRINNLTFNPAMYPFCDKQFRIYRKVLSNSQVRYELINSIDNPSLNQVNAYHWNQDMFQVIALDLYNTTKNTFKEELL